MDRQYVRFNLDALCDFASSAGLGYLPNHRHRLDGGRIQQGSPDEESGRIGTCCTKIPCPSAGPSVLTTASEVVVCARFRLLVLHGHSN